MSNIGSALPVVAQNKVWFCVAAILLVMALNLRGIRESGAAFAIPTYAFIVGDRHHDRLGIVPDLCVGQSAAGRIGRFPDARRARRHRRVRLVFLVARSFSSGCAALTGVEAISNGVPAFQKPKSRNAATTLLMLGAIAVTLLMGIIVLAEQIGVQARRGSRRPS